MSDEPGAEFGIGKQAVLDLARSLERAGTNSLEDAFPAALVASTWRALLENGVVEAPTRVDLDRVEVRLTGPKGLELRVPVRFGDGEVVKAVAVVVEKWSASGAVAAQLEDEGEKLARALELAASQPTFDHYPGSGQKPHN
jgi:hypothetical protein